jgi:hypothetical protein
MGRMLGVLLVFGLLAATAQAAERMKFWNLTANTISELYLAPAGTESWGPNQTKNDHDGTVDHDERLPLKGVEPGRYDVKFTDTAGRHCLVRNVELQGGKPYAFSLDEKELKDCTKK